MRAAPARIASASPGSMPNTSDPTRSARMSGLGLLFAKATVAGSAGFEARIGPESPAVAHDAAVAAARIINRSDPARALDVRRSSFVPHCNPHSKRSPPTTHLRNHFPPRCGQDHADREAAAVLRRDPDRRLGEGAKGNTP